METARFGLVVNAAAKGVRRRFLDHDPFWQKKLPEEMVSVTHSLDDLEPAITRFQAMGVDSIACLGGDGTLHHLVSAIISRYGSSEPPAILALAGGTMNGLSRALLGAMPPQTALRAALAAHNRDEQRIEMRNVLQISNAVDEKRFYAFSFATGLPVRALQHYYRANDPGMADALRASLLPITSAVFKGNFYDPTGIELEADGGNWPERPHSILASVLDNPLLWFRPFGRPLLDRRHFHLAATAMTAAAIAPRLWSIFRGHCRHPDMRTGPVTAARIRGDTGYVIDGELGGIGERLDALICPGPRLRFIVPDSGRNGPLQAAC